ncbi:VirK/YbjX family protein [Escherichia coli]|uniref:VirK/YbjX family protein n=1 Tax=Escherichia coli TaxID=562 RepID=UPI000A18860C|nr:VirK/YbjX family protein [Escherichia coli]OSL96380.1 required for proper localization of IcsA (VirG) at the surface of bacteria [Escherichia coli T426]
MNCFVSDLSFINFLKKVVFSPESLHGKWKNRKFRFMYVLRCAINPVASIRYYHELCSLDCIENILVIQPTLPAKIHRPYLHKGGRAWIRGKYILEHYKFVQNLPREYSVLLLPKEPVSLVQFSGKDNEEFDIHCSSSDFDREGELTLSLCFNKIPVARLTFSVISTPNGNSAFIGGLQGAPKNVGPELIKCATRACYGLFPKRIIFEAFCSLMKVCNVSECLAVSEHSHVFRQLRYRYQKRKSFVAIYSDFWESVEGKKCDNWYELPIQTVRKPLHEIASKKRSEYRKKYVLLDHIHDSIACLFKHHSDD